MVLSIRVVIVAAAVEQSSSYQFKLIIDVIEMSDQTAALRYGLAFGGTCARLWQHQVCRFVIEK